MRRKQAPGTKDELATVAEIQCSHVLRDHTNFISCISVSESPQPYLASSSWDCTILIHDVNTKELLATIHNPAGAIISDISTCTRIGVSDVLASFSMDGKIRVYDALRDWELIHCFEHASGIECSVLGAVKLMNFDRPYCVSGGVDKIIRIRDLNEPAKVLKVLRGHTGGIKCLDISESGMIASGSDDDTVKLWDIFTGKFIRTLRGHSLEVNIVKFISNSSWLLSGSEDNLFRVWDVTQGQRLRVFKGHQGATISSITSIYVPGLVPPMAIIGGTEKETFFSPLMNPLEVWRLDTAQCIGRCVDHRDEVAALTTYCEMREGVVHCEVFSGGVDKTVRVWDFTSFLRDYLISIEDESLDDDTEFSGSLSELDEEKKDVLDNGSLYSEL